MNEQSLLLPPNACITDCDPCEKYYRYKPSILVIFSGITFCNFCSAASPFIVSGTINGAFTMVRTTSQNWSVTVPNAITVTSYSNFSACTGSPTGTVIRDLIVSMFCAAINPTVFQLEMATNNEDFFFTAEIIAPSPSGISANMILIGDCGFSTYGWGGNATI